MHVNQLCRAGKRLSLVLISAVTMVWVTASGTSLAATPPNLRGIFDIDFLQGGPIIVSGGSSFCDNDQASPFFGCRGAYFELEATLDQSFDIESGTFFFEGQDISGPLFAAGDVTGLQIDLDVLTFEFALELTSGPLLDYYQPDARLITYGGDGFAVFPTTLEELFSQAFSTRQEGLESYVWLSPPTQVDEPPTSGVLLAGIAVAFGFRLLAPLRRFRRLYGRARVCGLKPTDGTHPLASNH